MDRWKRYGEELPNKNITIEKSHIRSLFEYEQEPLPTFSEFEKAMKEIKSGKSTGYDEISEEMIKNGGDNITQCFHKLCIKIWNMKLWLDDWAKPVFIPIPKKGDTLECCNNRTIALISHCSTVLLTITVGRMKKCLETRIVEEQHGFRARKGTRDQILNLKMIIEKNREQTKFLYLCFIDYRNVFDTVVHEILWHEMRKMGFPTHIII